jgi:hypothetical protein
MLDELDVRIAAETANVTKDILQHVWQQVNYRREVYRANDDTNYDMFCT